MSSGFQIESIHTYELDHLKQSMFFGDQSQLAKKFRESKTNASVSELLVQVRSRLDEYLAEEGIPKYVQGNIKLCEALKSLSSAYGIQLDSQAELNDAKTDAYKNAESNLSDAIKILDKLFSFGSFKKIPIPKSFASDAGRIELFRLLDKIHEQRATSVGFWIAAYFIEACLGQPYLPHEKCNRRVHTPVLFHNGMKDQGEVLWLEVELRHDFKGIIMPDIHAHGLMDVSHLVAPMTQVWRASGLTDRYGCVWRYLSRCPDIEFPKVNEKCIPFLPGLEGKSIQAAAMAAIWAAAGEIPMIQTHNGKQVFEPFYMDPQRTAFTLSPYVAITACLDLGDLNTDLLKGQACSQTRLKPVTEGIPKAYAMVNYTGDKRVSLFDSLIVCQENETEAKSGLKSDQQKSRHLAEQDRGATQVLELQVLSNCQTIGDALDWMLDVNRWKRAYNEHCQKAWEDQWGFARDAEQRFLGADGKPLADQESVEGRIKTGSLAYMMQPVGGATEPDEDEQAQPNDADDSDLV